MPVFLKGTEKVSCSIFAAEFYFSKHVHSKETIAFFVFQAAGLLPLEIFVFSLSGPDERTAQFFEKDPPESKQKHGALFHSRLTRGRCAQSFTLPLFIQQVAFYRKAPNGKMVENPLVGEMSKLLTNTRILCRLE